MATRTALPGTSETATGTVHDGADDDKLPGGWIGYVEITSAQNGITTEADITGLSVTVTVNTSRRIKITGYLGRIAQSAADTGASLRIKESTTELAVSYASVWVNNGVNHMIASRVLTPSAASHTYKLTMQSATSTNVEPTTTSPAYLLVEDLGPAS